MIVYARFEGLAASYEFIRGERFLPTTFPEVQIVPVHFRHQERLDGAAELTVTDAGLWAVGHVLLDDADPASIQAHVLRCIRAGIMNGMSVATENGIRVNDEWTSLRVKEVTLTAHPADWRCKIDKWHFIS